MPLHPVKRLTQHSAHRIITGPAAEPVTLAEVRELLRQPPTDDNSFIETCLTQARIAFEAYTNIACITQSWRLTLDHWPGGREELGAGFYSLPVSELYSGSAGRAIELPRYPLSEVTSVTTYDEGDNSSAVSVGTVFFVDLASLPGRLCLRSGQTWPIALRDYNSIEIAYVAGFGAAASAVPEELKRAIGQIAAYLYEHRGEGCTPMDAVRKSGALALASTYIGARI